MSKTLDRTILERAIKLVEAGWTQYAYARDANGKAVDWRSGAATSFCAVGAILRAMHDLVGAPKDDHIGVYIRIVYPQGKGRRNLMHCNDTSTKERTLQLMQKKMEGL